MLLPVAAVTSEQEGEIQNLTGQIVLLRTDVTHLERRTEQLAREKDRLNWTVGAILQHDVFSVKDHCPQKGSNISHSSSADVTDGALPNSNLHRLADGRLRARREALKGSALMAQMSFIWSHIPNELIS